MRTSIMPVGAILAVILTVGVGNLALAIGEDEDPQVAYCQSLVELTAAVEGLKLISVESTVEEFEAAVDRAREAATGVEDSLRALVESQVAGLESAVGGVESYRDTIEDDQTIEQVVQGAAASIEAVDAARSEVGVIPNCAIVAGQEVAEDEAEG
jgi:hypothetical protein